MNRRSILGITTSGHGVGAALCIDGKIVGATNLERLTRKKYDIMLPISKADLITFGWKGNPRHYEANIDLPFDLHNDYSSIDFSESEKLDLLINYILSIGGISFSDLDCVAYSYRHVESMRKYFKDRKPSIDFIVPEHHFAHACQAYLASPFEEAAIMILDGQGVPLERTGFDQLSGCIAFGKGGAIEIINEFPVADSLGGMYAEITKMCGFKTNEEGKTMGLAPYGTDELYVKAKPRLGLKSNKYSLEQLMRRFKRNSRSKETLYNLGKYRWILRNYPRRSANGEFTELYKNIAFMGQKILEDVVIYLANWLHDQTGCSNVCIAGGVGLGCVANYEMLINSGFKNIFISPNSGDNGLAVGQALYVDNIIDGNPRIYVTTHDYLGKKYSETEIERAVNMCAERNDVIVTKFDSMQRLYCKLVEKIEKGQIVSWWQGRSEFGPRALGNRSILADPRKAEMKDILNSRVKFRESYRPFCPSVLQERASEYFALDVDSPYMLLAPYVKPGKEKEVPAITHVDNTARVQTVNRAENEKYYSLIKEFEKQTGTPMLLNTSFNVSGEPIVETPGDAIHCFLSTDIDVIGLSCYYIEKIIKN